MKWPSTGMRRWFSSWRAHSRRIDRDFTAKTRRITKKILVVLRVFASSWPASSARPLRLGLHLRPFLEVFDDLSFVSRSPGEGLQCSDLPFQYTPRREGAQ